MSTSLSQNSARSFARLDTPCRYIYLFLLALSIGNFLAHAYPLEDTPSYCKDRKRVKIRVDGEQIRYCDWVGEEDTEERCNTPYEKKKKRNNKKKNNKKKNNKILDARTLCTCTCAEYLPEELDPEEKLCPDEMNDGIKNRNCLESGYQQYQGCEYNWVWSGCTLEELMCIPVDSYTCDNEEWIHRINSIQFCEPPPRGDPTDELPEPGTECQETVDVARPYPDPSPEDSTGDDLLEELDELDPEEKLCPDEMNDSIKNRNCLESGYQQYQVCEYNWVWSGCTLEELMCIPVDSYTCDNEEWIHRINSIQFCEEIRGVPRDELPEPGTGCQETVDVSRRRRDLPSAEDSSGDDLLQIRHR